MKYYIKRDLNEYGPYTLADLQRYVAQGNIVLTDLARSEGMTDWAPVSQVLGSIAAPPQPPMQPAPVGIVPSAQPAGAPAHAGPPAAQPAYGAVAAQGAASAIAPGPIPPDFHWALVLVIGFFCGIFTYVWLFIEASFVKKIKPDANVLPLLIGGLAGMFGSIFVAWVVIIAAAAANSDSPAFPFLVIGLSAAVYVTGMVLFIMGIFKMRAAIQEYYNTVEPINLRLSGVMTFFFAVWYFQYHFSRIAQWKKTGYLEPQG